MPQNKQFTHEQDKVLLYLADDLKIRHWPLVAKKMIEEYKIQKNAKQCRDRYKQLADPLTNNGWTYEQQKQLYRLHNMVGNKWALISSYFPGKTDNYVKNHFYSKIRKALRQVNKTIKTYFKKEFKQIKIAIIYKIIQGFQEQFKEKPIVSQQVSNECRILKDIFIAIADELDENQERLQNIDIQKQRQFIQKIYQFNRNYKKKSKKEKRESLQVDQLFKPAKKIQLIINNSNQDEQSQFQGVNSVASSDSDQNQMKEARNFRQDQMKQEKDQLRKSPAIYVIVKDDQSPNSVKSGIDIRLSDMSGKMQDEQKDQNKQIQNSSLNADQKCSFGFMRGQSSFRSYRSQSVTSQKSKTDMFGQIRISAKLKQICIQMEIQAERQQNIFRSQK